MANLSIITINRKSTVFTDIYQVLRKAPLDFVGDKEKKRANLKTEVTRKQSTPIFPKNEHFLHPDTPL